MRCSVGWHWRAVLPPCDSAKPCLKCGHRSQTAVRSYACRISIVCSVLKLSGWAHGRTLQGRKQKMGGISQSVSYKPAEGSIRTLKTPQSRHAKCSGRSIIVESCISCTHTNPFHFRLSQNNNVPTLSAPFISPKSKESFKFQKLLPKTKYSSSLSKVIASQKILTLPDTVVKLRYGTQAYWALKTPRCHYLAVHPRGTQMWTPLSCKVGATASSRT